MSTAIDSLGIKLNGTFTDKKTGVTFSGDDIRLVAGESALSHAVLFEEASQSIGDVVTLGSLRQEDLACNTEILLDPILQSLKAERSTLRPPEQENCLVKNESLPDGFLEASQRFAKNIIAEAVHLEKLLVVAKDPDAVPAERIASLKATLYYKGAVRLDLEELITTKSEFGLLHTIRENGEFQRFYSSSQAVVFGERFTAVLEYLSSCAVAEAENCIPSIVRTGVESGNIPSRELADAAIRFQVVEEAKENDGLDISFNPEGNTDYPVIKRFGEGKSPLRAGLILNTMSDYKPYMKALMFSANRSEREEAVVQLKDCTRTGNLIRGIEYSLLMLHEEGLLLALALGPDLDGEEQLMPTLVPTLEKFVSSNHYPESLRTKSWNTLAQISPVDYVGVKKTVEDPKLSPSSEIRLGAARFILDRVYELDKRHEVALVEAVQVIGELGDETDIKSIGKAHKVATLELAKLGKPAAEPSEKREKRKLLESLLSETSNVLKIRIDEASFMNRCLARVIHRKALVVPVSEASSEERL